MSKHQPSKPATSGIAGAFIDAVVCLATSPDPKRRLAGWIIIAGCFVACLSDPEVLKML